jgi:hypothetical protein
MKRDYGTKWFLMNIQRHESGQTYIDDWMAFVIGVSSKRLDSHIA